MTTGVGTKKPRVVGIVGLGIIGGVANLLEGIALLALIAAASAKSGESVPMWVTLTAYLIVGLGVTALLVAVLLLMYKRIGLILAAMTFGIGLLLNLYSALSGSFSVIVGVSIVIQLAVLYYVRRYLMREPERHFFT